MNAALATVLSAVLLYVVFSALGYGLSRLLCDPDESLTALALAPWTGMALAGCVLMMFGHLNVPASPAFAAVFVASAIFYALARNRLSGFKMKSALAIAGIVALFTLIAMSPVWSRAGRLTSFTIGNRDLIDYVMASRKLSEDGLSDFLHGFQQIRHRRIYDPEVKTDLESWPIDASAQEKRLYAFMGYLPRWLPAYALSFASSELHSRPERLFTLLCVLSLALLIPVVFVFAERTFGADRRAAIGACILAAANPHMLYLAYHGFLPQLMGTGLFIGFLISAADLLLRPGEGLRAAAFCGLFASGILMTYPQLFPYMAIAVAGMAVLSVGDGIGWAEAAQRLGAACLLAALLAPYPAYRLIPLLRAEFTQSVYKGGWNVTDGFYLLPFQLGAFLSPASTGTMRPTLILEWILNPVLLFLAVVGLASLGKKWIALAVLVPFVLAGLFAFLKNQNYAFFKNSTLAYFLAPILVTQGAWRIWERRRSLGYAFSALLLMVTAVSAVQAASLMRESRRLGEPIPEQFFELKQSTAVPKGTAILASGLSRWEVLAANANLARALLLPYRDDFFANEPVSTADPSIQFVIRNKNVRAPLLDLGEEATGKTVWQAGPYTIEHRVRRSTSTAPGIILERGFAGVENDGKREWIWVGRALEITLDAPAAGRATLGLEIYSRQDQVLSASLNGKPVRPLELLKDQMIVFFLPLNLQAGLNSLLLKSDHEPPPPVPGDSRPLNFRISGIILQ